MKHEIELTLDIASTPFQKTLLGNDDQVIATVLTKMKTRIPEQKRGDMALTERNLREVIKEIHEPATCIKVKDWHYVLNLTGFDISAEIRKLMN
tara:strand:+ start:1410 stop:1691 length:282 start_codon:yes stop_codon:yes gene_type:complete